MTNKEKILQALNYLASSQPNRMINEMKAYKLLWLADRYHLRQYGRTITNDQYYAMPFGIVPSVAKQMVDGKTYQEESGAWLDRNASIHCIRSLKKPDMRVFSESDVEALSLILEKYGRLNQQELSNLSHEFPEWRRFAPEFSGRGKKSYRVRLGDFFLNYDDGRGLFNDDEEFLSISKELAPELN